MKILIKDLVQYCDTTRDGTIAFDAITNALKSHQQIQISFLDRPSATSTFVNVVFVQLLDSMSFADIRRRLKITECTPLVAKTIKDRLTFEAGPVRTKWVKNGHIL